MAPVRRPITEQDRDDFRNRARENSISGQMQDIRLPDYMAGFTPL